MNTLQPRVGAIEEEERLQIRRSKAERDEMDQAASDFEFLVHFTSLLNVNDQLKEATATVVSLTKQMNNLQASLSDQLGRGDGEYRKVVQVDGVGWLVEHDTDNTHVKFSRVKVVQQC